MKKKEKKQTGQSPSGNVFGIIIIKRKTPPS